MAVSECGRFAGAAWQELEERAEPLGVEDETRRQLPKNRTEFVLEREDAGGEEIRQRRFHITQLLHVRDESAAFDREPEIIRCLVLPP